MIDKKDLLFPHEEIRKTQDALIIEVDKAIKEHKHLIVHAPTGLGKTVSAISPALSHALKTNKLVFFLTCRHTQHKIAIQTLEEIKIKHKKDFNVVDLIGKKFMCPLQTDIPSSDFNEFCKVTRENCEYYNNMKKINKKLAIEEIKDLTADVEKVKEICINHKVCPFEISMTLLEKANIVIGDYYHILNPKILDLILNKSKKSLKDLIIIIDEAHNLAERARELLTHNLSTLSLQRAIRESEIEELTEIKNTLESLNKDIPLDKNPPEILIEKHELKFDSSIIPKLNKITEIKMEKNEISYSKSIANFLEAWTGEDYGFVRILSRNFTKQGKINITLSYKCLDPSISLKDIINESTLILMSGTLKPTEMYKDLLGFKEVTLREYKDPFPKENRLNLIVPNVTTRYTQRSNEMYEKIAINCANIVNLVPGNSAIFFPSYELRNNVNNFFEKLCKKTTFLEQRNMSRVDKEDFIERFKKYKSAVLLAIAKANFGEGIDLPNLLKAVIVVGLPLSRPDLETKALIQYYNEEFEKGMDYGYILPAFIRCLQNAGRCIRSETDKGIIIFLDERFNSPFYSKLFPDDMPYKITKNPEKEIKEFFNL